MKPLFAFCFSIPTCYITKWKKFLYVLFFASFSLQKKTKIKHFSKITKYLHDKRHPDIKLNIDQTKITSENINFFLVSINQEFLISLFFSSSTFPGIFQLSFFFLVLSNLPQIMKQFSRKKRRKFQISVHS